MARGSRNQVGAGLRLLWALLAVALTLVGFAAASCGSGNGQAGSALSNTIGSAGGGQSLPGSGLPTTSTPPSTPTETVTTTTPPVTTTTGTTPTITTSSTSVTLTTTTPPATTLTGAAIGSTADTGTGSDSGVSGWVYALIGAAVVALIAAVVWLIRRGRKPPPAPGVAVPAPKPLAERQAILLAEVERRLQSGWTVVAQTADTAMLERSGEITRVTVDEYGTLHEIPSPPSGG
ncbi:MAG TPA: hypothetical protein VGJ11_11340 [Gaiellales bacterium]